MRRIVLLSVLFGAASTALFAGASTGAVAAAADGTLVVRNGSAAPGKPVVMLTITGSVIGKVDYGRIVIDPGPKGTAPVVTGADLPPAKSPRSETAQVWRGSDFTFRAVGGTYTILIYGSGVNLVASGTGKVRLAGVPDTPKGDGKYSLDGAPFVSLPGTPLERDLGVDS